MTEPDEAEIEAARRARARLIDSDDVSERTKANLRNVDVTRNPGAVLALARAYGIDVDADDRDD